MGYLLYLCLSFSSVKWGDQLSITECYYDVHIIDTYESTCNLHSALQNVGFIIIVIAIIISFCFPMVNSLHGKCKDGMKETLQVEPSDYSLLGGSR